jgi:hypothetical protein
MLCIAKVEWLSIARAGSFAEHLHRTVYAETFGCWAMQMPGFILLLNRPLNLRHYFSF